MNERIEELAKQAYGIDDAKPLHPSALVALDAFAKLIIKECAEICLEANDHKNILRHFGVEE